MWDDPLVSVIVPTFRRNGFLLLTARSILEQTHSNLELIVVADGHDPETEKLVANLNDSRASYCSIAHSGLPAAARNEGLKRARGSFLAFCDDDDLWHESKLQAQLDLMDEGEWDFLCSDYFYIDSSGEQLPYRNFYDSYYGEISRLALYHSMGFICTASVMVSRRAVERVGDFQVVPDLRVKEDFEYWLRILDSNRGFFSPQKLVFYRFHDGSIQRGTPWGVFKARWRSEKFVRICANIPFRHYLRKQSKNFAHLILDLFPLVKKVFRLIQGKNGLPEQ